MCDRCCLAFFSKKRNFPICPGLGDRYSKKKAGAFPKMESENPLPPSYYNLEIKGLSVKDVGLRITVLY